MLWFMGSNLTLRFTMTPGNATGDCAFLARVNVKNGTDPPALLSLSNQYATCGRRGMC